MPAFLHRPGNQRSVPSQQRCVGPDVRREKAMCGATTKWPHRGTGGRPPARARDLAPATPASVACARACAGGPWRAPSRERRVTRPRARGGVLERWFRASRYRYGRLWSTPARAREGASAPLCGVAAHYRAGAPAQRALRRLGPLWPLADWRLPGAPQHRGPAPTADGDSDLPPALAPPLRRPRRPPGPGFDTTVSPDCGQFGPGVRWPRAHFLFFPYKFVPVGWFWWHRAPGGGATRDGTILDL